MVGSIYKDNTGKLFEITMVDHIADGSWVHYREVGTENRYNCLIGAFKQRFTPVEKSR